MRYSAKLGFMLAPLLSLITSGVVLNKEQEDRFNSLRGMLPGTDGKTRRGKGVQAKHSKRTNRSNISARVRRKHRRAA